MPTEELAQVRIGHPSITIQVEESTFPPDDLRRVAADLVRLEKGVGAAEVLPDGSGLSVWVDTTLINETVESLERRLSTETGYPVVVNVGAPSPAPDGP